MLQIFGWLIGFKSQCIEYPALACGQFEKASRLDFLGFSQTHNASIGGKRFSVCGEVKELRRCALGLDGEERIAAAF